MNTPTQKRISIPITDEAIRDLQIGDSVLLLSLIHIFRMYAKAALTEEGFEEYLQKYILGVKSHEEYLELIGGDERLAQIKADEIKGY